MEFKIMDLVEYYLKNIFLNIIVVLIVFVIGTFYTYNNHEKEYIANTSIMLGVCTHDCDGDEHLNVEFNKKVLFDYMQLIKSDAVLNKAIKYSNLDYKAKEVRNMLNVSYEEDTEYINIMITSKNKNHSAKLSYNIYKGLEEEVKRIFDISNIHLVDTNDVGYLKDSNNKLNIYILFISFVISIVITIIKFLFFSNFKKNK